MGFLKSSRPYATKSTGLLGGEVAQQVQSGLADVSVRLTNLGTQVASASHETADALHSEIDEARDLVRNGQAQVDEQCLC
jgi:hypothetical protein